MKKTTKYKEDNNTTCTGQQHSKQRTAYTCINNSNHQQCTKIFTNVNADQTNTVIVDLDCVGFY